MKYIKNQIYETYYESSTIPKGTMATLGTIESDACSHFGKHEKQLFRGESFIKQITEFLSFESVIDIGSGEGRQKLYFESCGKKVSTCDFSINNGAHCNNQKNKYDYVGDFVTLNIPRKFDLVFSSHVLEHQRNVGLFLEKKKEVCKDNGFICTIVPIRKPFVTGGHCSIWNPGLLLYNLILAGVDCSECYLKQTDYDICVIVKNKQIDLKKENLTYDMGDVNKLMKYFPFELTEPFNGDIMHINTLWS